MNKVLIGLLILFGLGVTIVPAGAGPIYNCSSDKAAHKAICDYVALQKLDKIVTDDYLTLVRMMPKDKKSQIQWEQKTWMVYRDKCGYSSGCIEMKYRSRMKRLSYWREKYGKTASK